jgi:hypothetical protein
MDHLLVLDASGAAAGASPPSAAEAERKHSGAASTRVPRSSSIFVSLSAVDGGAALVDPS